MDLFSQFSDPHPLGSSFDRQHESSSLSDSGSSQQASAHSDEEVLLATSHPKKRAGRRIFKETRHPIFRGVRKRNGNKWVCEVREPNKKTRIWLGTYPTLEMAARAHDVAALALRGKSACLNFADSAWRLPVPVSNEARDIRRAATAAAELFRPAEFGGQVNENLNAEECGDVSSRISGHVEGLPPQNVCYMDEEAELNMPGLLVNMAEGLLLSPPGYMWDGANWDDKVDDDWSLWSY